MSQGAKTALETYALTPGLLLHDWGDSTAVIFVPGSGATHLIEGMAALLVSGLRQAEVESLAAADSAGLEALSAEDTEALIPGLLQVGILQRLSPAASAPPVPRRAPPLAPPTAMHDGHG